ncbi:hypothetical protein RIF29_14749 [Crotalaria pallida]|uniref:RING-type domain-containing protein n=1 Tax=Crotalaria pallida TaxID=3830 RepID=A0AAN9FHN8_CROPI
MDLDLNHPPPSEGPSTYQLPVAMIDLDSFDDDVLESSPRSFAQAKTNSRRTRGRTIVDVDLGSMKDAKTILIVAALVLLHLVRTIKDILPSFLLLCVTKGAVVGVSGDYCTANCKRVTKGKDARKSPEPPKDPVFNCPICMEPLIEPMSTKCGHIFCKNCIRSAISAQAKCPTCRKKITVRELIRVFLPSTS